MVIDYRNLNAKTKTYNYPVPKKILKIRKIQGYNYFSKFDEYMVSDFFLNTLSLRFHPKLVSELVN